ncbi:unnamed protein product [Orchesella dallaii]|uniref:C2H2-type domain-containing protein n=1 Tax=Orchesella dallaii TaxID=48710 RepID=A0ABP1PHZ2_9HEXA
MLNVNSEQEELPSQAPDQQVHPVRCSLRTGEVGYKWSLQLQLPLNVDEGEIPTTGQYNFVLLPPEDEALTSNHAQEQATSKMEVHEEVVERQACKKCGSLIKNLAGHMQQSHPKKEDLRFDCLECGKKFVYPTRLRQHQLSKHGEGKKMKCERCEELFKTKREITDHVNSKHLNTKPHKCPQCGMDFTQKSSCTRHIRGVHNGIKPVPRRRLTEEK